MNRLTRCLRGLLPLFASLLCLSAFSATPVVDAAGNTSLHLAALQGDEAGLDRLLAEGANPNIANASGAVPLHYAVMSERMVASLLAHGANPNVISKFGMSPLMCAAARADSFSIISRLLQAGADVNIQREFSPLPSEAVGNNALALAILSRSRRTIDLLLDRKTGLDPTLFPAALAQAAMSGDVVTTRRLLERGANPDEGIALPGNPLNSALASGHPEVAKVLIEHGAKLQTKSIRGPGTPPMVFSTYDDLCKSDAAQLLVERGVDINATDDAGETALSYALKRDPDSRLVHWLKENGAKAPATAAPAKKIPDRPVPTDTSARVARIREGSQRAIDLMQISSTAFLENGFVKNKAQCISCHQQSLPAAAYGLARERGLRIDERELGRQLLAKIEQRSKQLDRARQLVQPTGGATVPLGYDAEEMHALRSPATEITEATSYFLLGVQQEDGSWPTQAKRMPMTDGPIVATAWAVRALQLYPPTHRQAQAQEALRRSRVWLLRQKPETLNQDVHRLLGLAWAGETREGMQPFIAALIKEQQPDGGWKQLPALRCDAWATGSALVALYQAGVPTSDAAYQRGVDFLLRTQFDDGSWWVRSRSWPFQPHFNSKFPHGKDQWISAGGTAWATIALLLTLEPTVDPATLPSSDKMIAAFQASVKEEHRRAIAQTGSTAPTALVDFAHDIQPILDRSCVKCHSGPKPKGSFDLTRRESLLRGGQSGEPAIIPGYADDSPLIQQVLGHVEDLEMPPLSLRGKFPELSAEEIDRLRTWIDAGAPWSQAPLEARATTASLPSRDHEEGVGSD